jgi:sporulation protein YlmC with PRC-barrel domain
MAEQKRDSSAIHVERDQTDSAVTPMIAEVPLGNNAVAQEKREGGAGGNSEQKNLPSEITTANSLIGGIVHNRQGEYLGSVKELMLNFRTGKIAYILLSFGDRFSIREKLFAIPWSALTPDPANKRFVLDIDRNYLKNAPGFDWKNWPDMTEESLIEDIHQGHRI